MALTSAFSRFYADGLMHAPAALRSGLQAELFATLRDFCQRTNVWQEDIDITPVSDTLVYTLTISSGKAIQRLLNLYDAEDLTKRTVWPGTMATPGTLILQRAPGASESGTWVATVAIYPLDPTDADGNPVFPDWILDKYFDTLFSGMLSRMMSQPGKPWSSLQMASFHYRKYTAGRGQCIAEVQRENLGNAQSWTYPLGDVSGRQRGV